MSRFLIIATEFVMKFPRLSINRFVLINSISKCNVKALSQKLLKSFILNFLQRLRLKCDRDLIFHKREALSSA